MCYRPLKVRNQSRRFSEHYSPLYHHVPCGQCESCLKNISDEYFIRSYFEWLLVSVIGSTFFITLTYDDKHLPILQGVQYFDKTHVQSFIKKLRIYLKRAGYGDDFRYFVVSEYGGKYKRVHFHILLFFPYKIDSSLLIAYLPPHLSEKEKDKLKGFVQRAWIYGFSSYSKKGAEVQTAGALRYCCKYLCKFNDIRQQKNYSQVIDRKRKPFHLQSKGYGLNMLNYLTTKDKLKCRVRIVTDNKKESTFTLPVFIQRYLYYDYDKETNLYTINLLGIYVKTEHLQKKVDEISEQISNFFDVKKLRSFVGKEEDKILNALSVDSLDSLVHEFCKIPMYQRTRIAEYLSFPRYVVEHNRRRKVFPNIFNMYSEYMHVNYNGFLYEKSPLSDDNYFNKLKHYTYEFSHFYLPFSYLVECYEIIRYILDSGINHTRLVKRKRDEEIQSYFNNLDYE